MERKNVEKTTFDLKELPWNQEVADQGNLQKTNNVWPGYVSVYFMPDHSPGKPPGKFFEKANSPPPGKKKVRKPNPWSRKIVLKPQPLDYYSQKSSKKPTKHETEIMTN